MANTDFEMTPAERHYAETGGDTSELEKTGGLQPNNGDQQQQPQQQDLPRLQLDNQPQQVETDDDSEPDLDDKTGRPKQRGKWVSKKALDEARSELRELRQKSSNEIATEREKWARLEERFKTFQEALAAPEPEPEEPEQPLPDPEQDIIGFNRGVWDRTQRGFQTLEQRLEQIAQQVGGINEHNTAAARTNEMVSAYRADAATFAQKQADFGDAYRFLISSRDAELQAAGYDNPAERQRLIVADEQALVARALQGQASPAERIYALAKARGYQIKAPANGNGQQRPNGNGRLQPNVTEEIARAQAGQNAAMSLSNAGGGTRVTSGLSLDEIANMSDDQFRSFARKNPQAFAAFEQMLGKGQ